MEFEKSLKKPKFNVFDVKITSDNLIIYIQNIGSQDAHSVDITVQTPRSGDGWGVGGFHHGILSTLRVNSIEKVVIGTFFQSVLQADKFKITVTCKEGVTQEFIFGY